MHEWGLYFVYVNNAGEREEVEEGEGKKKERDRNAEESGACQHNRTLADAASCLCYCD